MKFTCDSFVGVFRSLFNFTASKYVFIKDWRLVCFHQPFNLSVTASAGCDSSFSSSRNFRLCVDGHFSESVLSRN